MQDLLQNIQYPELLDNRTIVEIEDILEEYPYFQTVNMLYIKNLHNQGKIGFFNKLKKHSLWITNRTKLYYLIGKQILLPNEEIKKKEIIDFSDILQIATDIDSKIEQENDPLNQLIEQNIPYAEKMFGDTKYFGSFKNTLSNKDKETKKSLLDKFISNPSQEKINISNTSSFAEEADLNKQNSSDFMTETLAKIYTKQGHFDKAILIYEKLSLKYPKKNVYFADQIKKIKELINNNLKK